MSSNSSSPSSYLIDLPDSPHSSLNDSPKLASQPEGPCVGCTCITTDYDDSTGNFCHDFCQPKDLFSQRPVIQRNTVKAKKQERIPAPPTASWVCTVFSAHVSHLDVQAEYCCPFSSSNPKHQKVFKLSTNVSNLTRHLIRWHKTRYEELKNAAQHNQLTETLQKYSIKPATRTHQTVRRMFIRKPQDNIMTSQIFQALSVVKHSLSFNMLDSET